eukprot:758996-Hanusia_phi.AAC.1
MGAVVDKHRLSIIRSSSEPRCSLPHAAASDDPPVCSEACLIDITTCPSTFRAIKSRSSSMGMMRVIKGMP